MLIMVAMVHRQHGLFLLRRTGFMIYTWSMPMVQAGIEDQKSIEMATYLRTLILRLPVLGQIGTMKLFQTYPDVVGEFTFRPILMLKMQRFVMF